MFEKAKKVVNNVTIFTNQYENLTFNYNMYNKCKVLGIMSSRYNRNKKVITGCNSDKID